VQRGHIRTHEHQRPDRRRIQVAHAKDAT
jgi:hypothetical protein